MDINKSVTFLPPYLQTSANKKFLSGTLDLLTNQPKLSRFDGYVGRQWLNGKLQNGSYLLESTAPRQNYQLEPAFVTRDEKNNISGTSNFIDLLNSAANKDAITSSWNRLLTSGIYNWQGFVDLDKILNYHNYCWLDQNDNSWYWNSKISINDSLTNIIGKNSYTSPNNITLLNGMIISIDSNNYIVEGVGEYINLVNKNNIVTPPFVADQNNPPDYITINRAAPDLNLWSRTNLWVHKKTINSIINILGLTDIPNSFNFASRPIIEFIPLILFGQGKIGLSTVTFFDNSTPNAFSIVQGATSFTCNGTSLSTGDSIIFASDKNSSVRSTIYDITFITPNSTPVINLVPREITKVNSNVLVTNTYNTVIFDGANWSIASQNKTKINQQPLFDVYDINNYSFGNNDIYPETSFTGSKLFSYKIGSGTNDTVLGFPLTYGNIGNLNDIIFDNNYVSDSFSYTTTGTNPLHINNGKPHQIKTATLLENSYEPWQYIMSDGSLYQNTVAVGANIIKMIGTLKNDLAPIIYVDGKQLATDKFSVVQTGPNILVTIDFNLISSTSIIFIKISSSTSIANAWYDVPSSFSNNPSGQSIDTFTISDMRDHATTILSNSNNTNGLATLNLVAYKGISGTILYQESNSLISTILLTNPKFDIDQSIRTAGEDYVLFKQKLINSFSQIKNAQNISSKSAVDQALQSIASSFNSSQSWASSDMCFWGGQKTSYSIKNAKSLKFNLQQTYDWNSANYLSLQVYLNNNQLIYGRDYTTAGNILNIAATLNLKDTLDVYEISNTIGSYIPATPTKLGLSKSYIPQIYTDNTYQTPRKVIQGHDGSITSCFNDFRDNLLLDYELRVYNNLKVNNQLWSDTIETRVPQTSRFRTGPYSKSEQLSISKRLFYEWAAQYNISYSNNFYDESNLFTWNWSNSLDKLSDKQPLLGYWRGIYDWFYNSENPNTRPWELLNISIKPAWWDTTYGPSPYTGENLVMWNDIANGLIRNPYGITHSSYGVQLEMLDVIPVNGSGTLLSPNEAVIGTFDDSSAKNNFVYGDGDPVFTAWKRSSFWPFAQLRAKILQNPLFMLGTTWDTNNFIPTNNYYEFKYKNLLPSLSRIVINGVDSTPVNSIINYSVEYLRKNGMNPSILRSTIDNTVINLMYGLGGFSDISNLTVYASPNDPSDTGAAELIPNRDFSLFLNQSTPTGIVEYSGVIITNDPDGEGYKITGYDKNNPYFTIYPAITTGDNYIISVGNDRYNFSNTFNVSPEVIPYNTIFATPQDVINFLSGYGQYLIQNGIAFTVDSNQSKIDWSNAALQFIKWSLTNWKGNLSLVLNPSSSVIEYKGTSGTLYDLTDPLTSLLLDVNGNPVNLKYLDVSRDQNNVTITNQNGSIFSCIRANIISYEHRFIINNESEFNDIIYNPITGTRQTRLQLSGQKTSNWNGTLDIPGFLITTNNVDDWIPNKDYQTGSLVSWKNSNYIASVNIIGSSTFQYNQFSLISTTFSNQLLPNLSTKANDLTHAFDINYRPYLTDMVTLRNNTIGYVERDWLSSLDIDLAGQTDFYRGWIKEKGSLNSVNSYGRGSTPSFNTQTTIVEEYAMKVGEYGATARTGYGDVSLSPKVNTQNPLILTFVSTANTSDSTSIQTTPFNLYEKSPNWTNDFIQQSGNLVLNESPFIKGGPVIPDNLIKWAYNNIPGFIKSDESSLFFANTRVMLNSGNNISSILKIIENGGSFWLGSNKLADPPNQWDVLTFDAPYTQINAITQISANQLLFNLSSNIGVIANNIIAVDHVDSASNLTIQGIFNVDDYEIAPSANSYSRLIVTGPINNFSNITYDTAWTSLSLYTSRSLRGDSIGTSNIKSEDTVRYVQNDAKGWTSYDLLQPYLTKISYPAISNQDPISDIAYDDQNQILWSGKPTAKSGLGEVEVRMLAEKLTTGNIVIPDLGSTVYAIESYHPDTYLLGQHVVCQPGIAAISATTLNGGITGNGQVYIVQIENNRPVVTQILSGDGITNSNASQSYFGNQLSLSSDASWLYIRSKSMLAPNVAGISVYSLHTNESTQNYTIISNVSNIITVNRSIIDAYSIKISVYFENGLTQILIPNIDFSVNPNSSTINLLIPLDTYEKIYITTPNNYYKYEGKLIDPFGTSTGYGTSLSCDKNGETLVVGVPNYNSGAVIIYRRVKEKTYHAFSTANISPTNDFSTISSILVDGVKLSPSVFSVTYNSGFISNIIFSPALPTASTIQIEGFCFNVMQTIIAPNIEDSNFGLSVAINDNKLAVGSTKSVHQKGSLYFYALDTRITSQKIIPINDVDLNVPSINLNDWVVTRSGITISSLITDINNLTNYSGISATISNGNLILNIIQSMSTTGISGI